MDRRLRGSPIHVLCYLHATHEFGEYRLLDVPDYADKLGFTERQITTAIGLLVSLRYILEAWDIDGKPCYRLVHPGLPFDRRVVLPPVPRSATEPRKRLVAQAIRQKAKRTGGLACLICGNPKYQLHHIIPIACGGPDELQNIAPLCFDHHQAAHRLSRLTLPWTGPRTRDALIEQLTAAERAA